MTAMTEGNVIEMGITDDVKVLLKELIRTPSPYFQEQAIADYVYQFMENTPSGQYLCRGFQPLQ